MKNKKFAVLSYFLIISILLSIFNCSSSAKNPSSSDTIQPSSIKLATWNVRILSNHSRDDTELAEIADVLMRYDLIAIQEARDA